MQLFTPLPLFLPPPPPSPMFLLIAIGVDLVDLVCGLGWGTNVLALAHLRTSVCRQRFQKSFWTALDWAALDWSEVLQGLSKTASETLAGILDVLLMSSSNEITKTHQKAHENPLNNPGLQQARSLSFSHLFVDFIPAESILKSYKLFARYLRLATGIILMQIALFGRIGLFAGLIRNPRISTPL